MTPTSLLADLANDAICMKGVDSRIPSIETPNSYFTSRSKEIPDHYLPGRALELLKISMTPQELKMLSELKSEDIDGLTKVSKLALLTIEDRSFSDRLLNPRSDYDWSLRAKEHQTHRPKTSRS